MSELDAFYVVRDEKILARVISVINGNWRGMLATGHPMLVHLMSENARRTIEQNRLYWKLLSNMAEGAWVAGRKYDKDAWHEHMRMLFLPRLEGPDGSSYPVSTSSLNVKQFAAYIDQIEAYAANDLGIEA
jgi:hypothetical protein